MSLDSREGIGTLILSVWVFLVFVGNMRLFFGSHKTQESKLARIAALVRMKNYITSPFLIIVSTMIHGFLINLTFTLGWIPAFKLLIFNYGMAIVSGLYGKITLEEELKGKK